ncbi:MAG TPA: hypothetical protein VHE10_01065 [Candidatus Paceibacterota bacterium]|nr:hypothetical protein [Candidatus Paceibacterota bacterium]
MKKAFLKPSLVLGAALSVFGANAALAADASISSSCSNLASSGLGGLVGCIIGILDNITVIIIAASVVYIIWGAFNMIKSEEKRESGRQTVVYGIIGLFAMISIWGFVNILNNTFNLKQDYIQPPKFHP